MQVGDIVKFKTVKPNSIDYNFYTAPVDDVNQKYIKHGSINLKENKGIIKHIDDKLC